jgi:hypothetical protein
MRITGAPARAGGVCTLNPVDLVDARLRVSAAT